MIEVNENIFRDINHDYSYYIWSINENEEIDNDLDKELNLWNKRNILIERMSHDNN